MTHTCDSREPESSFSGVWLAIIGVIADGKRSYLLQWPRIGYTEPAFISTLTYLDKLATASHGLSTKIVGWSL